MDDTASAIWSGLDAFFGHGVIELLCSALVSVWTAFVTARIIDFNARKRAIARMIKRDRLIDNADDVLAGKVSLSELARNWFRKLDEAGRDLRELGHPSAAKELFAMTVEMSQLVEKRIQSDDAGLRNALAERSLSEEVRRSNAAVFALSFLGVFSQFQDDPKWSTRAERLPMSLGPIFAIGNWSMFNSGRRDESDSTIV